MRTRSWGPVALLLVVTIATGCSAKDKPPASTGTGGDAGRFGLAPQPNKEVTYQPDVVFLGSGAAAIRSASSDGLTWFLDKNAPGVDQLQVDKVMYATSLAVGRIVHMRTNGDEVEVTLAPVRIGEVIKNGRIAVGQELDLSGWGMQQLPDMPGTLASLGPSTDPSAEPSTGPSATPAVANGRPAIRAVARELPVNAAVPLPPPFTEGSAPWSAGPWSGQVTRSSGNVKFHLEHAGEGLKTYVDVGFHFASPHLDADLGIVDGQVEDSEIRLRGLREVTLDIKAGSANGLADNLNQKIEIPVSLNAPVIVGGVAMNLNVRFKFLVNTAFSAKNSTLEASGAWVTDGPLFYERASGQVTAGWPKVSVKKSLIDSLAGVSVGANGFVFATELRVMLGLGVPAVSAGPYARLVTSVGLTVGSDLGIVKCRQTTVAISASAGVGLSMSDSVANGINMLLKKLGATKQVEEDSGKPIAEHDVYNHSALTPDVPLCRSS